MDKKLTLKIIDGKNQLINSDEIKEHLIANNHQLILEFESGETDDEYRKSLQNELPNYHVFNVRWKPEIWIHPSIETTKILAKKEEIYNAAVSFREDGKLLVEMLCKAFDFELFANKGKRHLRSKIKQRRGSINDDWTFWFHGAECQFEHQKTGQIVEIIVTYGLEFGALDSFFFLRYLQTTPKFKPLADFFSADQGSFTKALNLLEDLGDLKRIDNYSQRGVVAN